jgi:hypothetical protein
MNEDLNLSAREIRAYSQGLDGTPASPYSSPALLNRRGQYANTETRKSPIFDEFGGGKVSFPAQLSVK